jgi:hypothetical protein
MDSEVTKVNRLLKRFDRKMFARRSGDGIVRVYCNAGSPRAFEVDGMTIVHLINEPYHVFSLTDTWGYWGRPCAYGYLPLWDKLRAVSLESRDRITQELDKSEKDAEAKRKRNLANLTESMAYEARDAIKELTKDVVFSNVDKNKDPRRKQDKKIKEI